MLQLSSIVVLQSFVLLWLSLFLGTRLLRQRRRQPALHPPGPRGLPLLGNLFNWPRKRDWETFTRWGGQYGEITYCNLIGQQAIILNSARLATELLERKGAIYSSRPILHVASELVGLKETIPLSPYGNRLRHLRRLFNQEVGSKDAVARFVSMEERMVHRFLQRVLDSPPSASSEQLFVYIRKLVGSILLSASHGYTVQEETDPFVSIYESVMADVERVAAPGAFLVDSFPLLDRLPSWFPGTRYRQVASEMRRRLHRAVDMPHDWVKAQIAAGTARPSFAQSQLEGRELSAEEDEVVKYATTAVFGAGSETTISVMKTFVFAMALHPEVQARARAEIDAVVGSDRLPRLADRERLPYVEAICKEVLRWRPPAPSGLPRTLTEDDTHEGYFFPKGTILMVNIWGLAHDPKTYRNPEEFDPSRFVPSGSAQPEQDPAEFAFGFGRRRCPGTIIFGDMFFLTCAMALASLDIGKARDANGKVVEPQAETADGLFFSLKPFPCSVKPLSPRAEQLVRAMVEPDQ